MGAATRGFSVNDTNGTLKGQEEARDASTLSGQTSVLHDELSELESTVNLLEGALEPLLRMRPDDSQEGEALEALPPAVDSVRQAGLRVAAARRRLYSLRHRLALL